MCKTLFGKIHKIETHLARRYNEKCIFKSVIKSAINEAKTLGFEDSELGELFKEQLLNGKKVSDLKNEIHSGDVFYSFNIAEVVNGWYLFYWVNEGKKSYVYQPLTPEGVELLARDIKGSNPYLTHDEYLSLREKATDHEALEKHSAYVREARLKLLNKYLGITREFDFENLNMIITRHSMQRWKERILLDNRPLEHLSSEEIQQICDDIIQEFKNSKNIYQIYDTVYFWSKKKNIFFIVIHNVIVTTYPKIIGKFNAEISRYIVEKQLEHLKSIKRVQYCNSQRRSSLCEKIDRKILIYDQKINKLQQEINSLISCRTKAEEEKSQLLIEEQEEKEAFSDQEKLLFINWTKAKCDILTDHDEENKVISLFSTCNSQIELTQESVTG